MSKNALLMYACDWFQGGLWRYAYNLSKQYLKLDHKGSYVFIHGQKKPENFLGLENGEKIFPYGSWGKIFQLPRQLQQEGFDVVHQTENACPIFTKGQRYKKIITIHDLSPLIFPAYFSKQTHWYYKIYLPIALKTVDRIICPSESTKKDLVSYYKIPPHKISVIYEGLEEKFFRKFSKEEIAESSSIKKINSPYILTMGINHHRNLISAFKAYKSLPENILNKYKLVVAGYSGLEQGSGIKFLGRATQEIHNFVSDSGLAGRVVFAGKLSEDDLQKLYQGAELFLFPSLSEGFGFPPLEAMASNCPVISSSATAMKETVGEAGVLVEPLDVDGFKRAMIDVLGSENLKQELREKGMKRARDFTWEKCAKEHLKVYYA